MYKWIDSLFEGFKSIYTIFPKIEDPGNHKTYKKAIDNDWNGVNDAFAEFYRLNDKYPFQNDFY